MFSRQGLKVSEQNGPLLGLAAIFVASLVVGLFVGGIWSRFEQKVIREDDYIVMVSLLFTRDGNLRAARERLAVLERDDINRRVVSLAEEFPRSNPDAQFEGSALLQLASALDTQGDVARPSATSTGTSADLPSESFSIWTWLGIILVVICVLGIGGPLALRLVSATRQGLSGAKFAHPDSRSGAEKWRGVAPTRRFSASARTLDEDTGQPASAQPPSEVAYASPPGRKPLQPTADPRPRVAPPSREPTSRFSSPRWNGATATFVSRYRHGVDPFDEVHPIVSPISGKLVGACGMSALLKFPDSAEARYYTISIWAQDYVSDEPLRCIGLVSAFCKAHPPVELMRWAQSRVADEIVVAKPGLTLALDSTFLKVEVNVLGLRYGIDVRGPEDGYFGDLEVSFRMQMLAEDDVVDQPGPPHVNRKRN